MVKIILFMKQNICDVATLIMLTDDILDDYNSVTTVNDGIVRNSEKLIYIL